MARARRRIVTAWHRTRPNWEGRVKKNPQKLQNPCWVRTAKKRKVPQ